MQPVVVEVVAGLSRRPSIDEYFASGYRLMLCQPEVAPP